MISESGFFDILPDETRRRLLGLLLREGELCVCELHYALDMAQPKISRHLAAMREAGLLAVRRDGTRIYYRLDTEIPLWAYRIIETMIQAGNQSALLALDEQRLGNMPIRPERLAA
jgi:ArsR family transcriptional regulator